MKIMLAPMVPVVGERNVQSILCCDKEKDPDCEDPTAHKLYDELEGQRLSFNPLDEWECELVGLCVKAGDNEGSGVCDGPGYGEHIEDFVTLDEDCDGAGGTGEVVVQ